MKDFIRCFVPLFVAIDMIGNLPIFLALTADMNRQEVRKVVRLAGFTAVLIGLLFMLGGKQLFAILHVSSADFKIAGGLVLFIIAVSGVLHDEPEHARVVKEQIGVVPIGIPLMVGPATLVTLLLLNELYPFPAVAGGLVANIAITLGMFLTGPVWQRLLPINCIHAISKVVHFLLAAVAIMMIRVGITDILH